MSKKPARPRYDWESIEKEYRAGQLSNVMLSEKYGPAESTIRQRAQRYGWQKELAGAVAKKIKEELIREDMRSDVRERYASDREIIDQAAATGAQVVRTHRKDIRTASELASDMMEELRDKESADFPKRAGILRDLSVVLKNLVVLERQAYNLNESSTEESYEDRLARLMSEK